MEPHGAGTGLKELVVQRSAYLLPDTDSLTEDARYIIMSTPSRQILWRSPVILESNKTSLKMTTPTSAPKPFTPRRDGNLKLRASCDACAASKVKCSKEHPNCARCLQTHTKCIYGVSRKHGKPGRVRKRNPDGSPFVKVTKQRPSPSGNEFGAFMLQTPPVRRTNSEVTSNWPSDWSPTPSLSTPSGFDSETAPEPPYPNEILQDTTYMETDFLSRQHVQPEPMSATGTDQFFQDPFTQEQTVQSQYPTWETLNDYMGSDDAKPMDYHPNGAKTVEHLRSVSSISFPYSPMSQTVGGHDNMASYTEVTTDDCHSCYPLAYSTLESLPHVRYPGHSRDSFDAVLHTVRSARENISRLLRCSCSSDPHLAMLYSSITSKILAWYQTAASINRGPRTSYPASASLPWIYCQPLPFSQTVFSPSSVTSIGDAETYNLYMQSSPLTQYKFDDGEQPRNRRQIVLHELRGCAQLVEALVNWGGNGDTCEQAGHLYEFLGGWLKSQLCMIMKQIEHKESSTA